MEAKLLRTTLGLSQEIFDNISPVVCYGITTLHRAAGIGHFTICQMIVKNVEDKNPKTRAGRTPLHYAAEKGHSAICQLIVENVQVNILKITKLTNQVFFFHFQNQNIMIKNF